MNSQTLANKAFPDIDRTLEYYEDLYPERILSEGAYVVRLAPSPTGFIHLGNLYIAMADEALASQSEGKFLLRIEDTDDKREVEGAAEALVESLGYFGVEFDEGEASKPEGAYGPYRQSKRAHIYRAAAKRLIERGYAYPCFCSETDIEEMHIQQDNEKASHGYYGKWAKCRDLSADTAYEMIDSGKPFTIRLKSERREGYFTIPDGIRGKASMPENESDIVLLKSNGIPTYHFAHVCDDHFMRVTHVLRGEEWLSSLPSHIELFRLMGWENPVYCHTSLLMKMDGGTKRKLSKRKDPELGLEYYKSMGYHPEAVREYLMTLLNSNYEEWRLENQGAPISSFDFSLSKMGSSGALVDLDKLNDVSKNVMARLSPDEAASFLSGWAKEYKPGLEKDMYDIGYLSKIASIGRAENNPRKDLIYAEQAYGFISFFFDSQFHIENKIPERISPVAASEIIEAYLKAYNSQDSKEEWFEKLKAVTEGLGYAVTKKAYQKDPGQYKGYIGEVSSVIRIALTGRINAPDIWEMQGAMGEARVIKRLVGFEKAYQGFLEAQ